MSIPPASRRPVRRVLVVDPDPFSAGHIGGMLVQTGSEYVHAKDIEEARERIQSRAFDLVVLGSELTVESAVAFSAQVRQVPGFSAPLIYVVELASDVAREHALDVAADEYLDKSFARAELFECLERISGRAANRRNSVRAQSTELPTHPTRALGCPVVLLTAGAGGPAVLRTTLGAMQQSEHACFVIHQQGPNWMLECLAHRLQAYTDLTVRMAIDDRPIKPGQVMIIPAGYKAGFSRDGQRLWLAAFSRHKDAGVVADALLESAATALGEGAIACLLSGTGVDGVSGAVSLRLHGGRVVVQEPTTAGAPGLARHALGLGAAEASCRRERLAIQLDELVLGSELELALERSPSEERSPRYNVLGRLS